MHISEKMGLSSSLCPPIACLRVPKHSLALRVSTDGKGESVSHIGAGREAPARGGWWEQGGRDRGQEGENGEDLVSVS